VEGRIGLTPVIRGYVAAAVLVREGGSLRAAVHESEEFVVAPLDRLSSSQRAVLESVGLPLRNSTAGERAHPILDIQVAAKVVEGLRESVELQVAHAYLAHFPDTPWLVVDGSIVGLGAALQEHQRVLGVIKSHDTQFLAGRDLEVALTIPAGHRTSMFARTVGRQTVVYTWYLRLWPWEEHELLHGLVRVERPAVDQSVADASTVSRWLLAERAPLAAPDGRWDRLLYPIRQVETYLRAQAGGWW
jgi:hypothetical protein